MDAVHTPAAGQPTRRSDAELRLPADGAYVSVIRTAASGLAARLDFTIDDIEDLRMAVSEACALVLPEADEGSDLVTSFYLAHGELTVAVSVKATEAATVDTDGWGWQVLSALTTKAGTSTDGGTFTVVMTLHSAADL